MKKNKRQTNIWRIQGPKFWRISKLMARLEDDLCFETTHSRLILRNDSIRKNVLP